eukprot:Platyproteum_vivax@DN734_c0_g1_i1.p1
MEPVVGQSLKRTVYVGGLEEQVTKEILRAAFIPFGEIKAVEIPMDSKSGKHRGFGFVEFEEEPDAATAIDNMHESEIYGRVISVSIAKAARMKPNKSSQPVWSEDQYFRDIGATDAENLKDPEPVVIDAPEIDKAIADDDDLPLPPVEISIDEI